MAGGPKFSGEFSEHRITSFDGLKLYVREYPPTRIPPALPVLCLPGLSRNGKDFHDLALRLAFRRKVFCPDYRGVGRSEHAKDWRSYCPQAWISDIRQILAATNQHRVAVIGTSFGGAMAAALAVTIPCAIAGVILNDVGPDISPGGLDKVLAHIGRRHRLNDWAAAVDYLKRSFPNLPATNDDRWIRVAQNTFREESGKLVNDWDTGVALSFRELMKNAQDLWPVFRALSRIPVLSIRGEKSDILSDATHRRMAEEIPGLLRITVPDVGHAPDLAEPSLAECIETFFQRVQTREQALWKTTEDVPER